MNAMAESLMLRGAPEPAPEAQLTELEARLAGAGGAALKVALLERLAGIESRLRREMADLQRPEDFVLRSLLADATLAASQCLGSWAVRAAEESLPLRDARMRGEFIHFNAGGVDYAGRVNGNSMSGTIGGAGGGTWTATRGGKPAAK